MSTPKTDAAAGQILDANEEYSQEFRRLVDGDYVPADFARQLERELNECCAERENLTRKVTDTAKAITRIIAEKDALKLELNTAERCSRENYDWFNALVYDLSEIFSCEKTASAVIDAAKKSKLTQ